MLGDQEDGLAPEADRAGIPPGQHFLQDGDGAVHVHLQQRVERRGLHVVIIVAAPLRPVLPHSLPLAVRPLALQLAPFSLLLAPVPLAVARVLLRRPRGLPGYHLRRVRVAMTG